LAELQAQDKPRILVLNKTDLLAKSKRVRLSHQLPEAVQVSALTGENLDKLRSAIGLKLAQAWPAVTLRLPYERADLRALVLRRGLLLKESYGQKAITLKVQLPPKLLGQLQEFRKFS
jgi:GTP-binding protein HflX